MIQGVTTAIVGFIFVCILFPKLVKNRTQFYAAFGMIVIMILLVTLAEAFNSGGFNRFVGVVCGALQLVALVMVVLATGGLSLKELTGEFKDALEVIRRGESEKEIIIPLTGQQPKPRRTASIDEEDAEVAARVIKPPPVAPPVVKPPESGSIPLE